MAEMLSEVMAEAIEDVHTAIPARVTRYDGARQQADLQPLIKVAHLDEAGERVTATLPVVRNCPVQFPGGGGFTLIYPVAVGDTGLLIFSEASLDKWLSSGDGGGEVDPDIDLRHHLTDGIFIPGIRPFGVARASTDNAAMLAGVDGGTFQGAGLGAALKTFLDLLKAAFDVHTHLSATPGNPTGPPVPLSPSVPTVESSTFKVTP